MYVTLAAAAILTFIAGAHAESCYKCLYIEGKSNNPGVKQYIDTLKAKYRGQGLNPDEKNCAASSLLNKAGSKTLSGVKLVPCKDGCLKQYYYTSVKSGGETHKIKVYGRECAVAAISEGCNTKTTEKAVPGGKVKITATICRCRGDKCNPGSRAIASLSMLVILLAFHFA